MTKGQQVVPGKAYCTGHKPGPIKNKLPGRIPEVVLLDDEDRIRLGGYRWSLDSHGYVQRHEYIGPGKYTKVKMHVEVMGFPKKKVDHINGIRTDCRKANLRLVSDREHCQNQAMSSRNTSGHRGVSWNKAAGAWYAYGKIEGKMISLGFFDDLSEAACVAREFREKNYRGYVDRNAINGKLRSTGHRYLS